MGGLAILCIGLLGLTVSQGPHVTKVDVSPENLVANVNQRMIFDANQQITTVEESQVHIAPQARFQVQTANDTVTLVFPDRLLYNTEYRVSIDDVTGFSADQPSEFTATFTTGERPFFYLMRGATVTRADGTPGKEYDEIITTGVRSTDNRVVYSAPYIQDFAVVGDSLAVVLLEEDRSNSLVMVRSDGDTVDALTLPGPGMVKDLQAAPEAGLLGFRFTSSSDASEPRFESGLFLIDLATAVAEPVLGVDGEPIKTSQWGFLPGRSALLAQAFDSSVLLLDPVKQAIPVPLGHFSAIDAFALDGTRVAVSDEGNRQVLDLRDGSLTDVADTDTVLSTRATTPRDGSEVYPAEVRFLASEDAFIEQVSYFDPVTGEPDQYVAERRGGEQRLIYEPRLPHELLRHVVVSPNDQYLAITMVPDTTSSVSDNYPVNSEPSSVTTLIVDRVTGEVVRSVVGFGIRWP